MNYQLNVIKDIYFDLEDTSIVNVFSAKVQNTGANNGQTGIGAECWYTLSTHFTWTTDNKWVYTQPPSLNAITWQAGMQVVRYVPRGMPNDTHAVDIFRNLFRRGQLLAKKHLPVIARVAGQAILGHLKNRPEHPWWLKQGASLASNLIDRGYALAGDNVTLKMNGDGS